MDFDHKVGLIEFGDEVISHFSCEYESENYKRDVFGSLDRHKAMFWPGRDASEMPAIWKIWLSDAEDEDWSKGNYRGVLAVTENSFVDMRKGRGLTERAIAIHYRMHRSLDHRELELALELDKTIFKVPAVEKLGNLFEYRPPDPSSFDGVNFAHQLARLEGAGWTQMPANSPERELQAEIFCGQVTRPFGGRRLRYGLREVWVRVTGTNFDVVRHYRGGEMDLPRHLHFHGDGTWRINASDAPTDNFSMLDGSVLAGPICTAHSKGKDTGSLKVEVYTSKTTPKLTILADNTDDEVGADDCERQNLIEKMFMIYLHKLHRLDGEKILLSSKGVPI